MNNQLMHEKIEQTLIGFHDDMFSVVIDQLHCMSRARVYAMLNAVVSSLEEGELYVEVGTYQGGSLISALLDNNARAIGVDAFCEFKETNNFDQTQANLRRFGVDDRAVLRNMTYQDFFLSVPAEFSIQAYYYDGAHDYQSQLNGMEAAWDYLHAGSVVLVDDYCYPEVYRAVNQFVENHKANIRFLFVRLPQFQLDKTWWNGCVIMEVV
jgi:predicted O-methyltransferase YrrM